MSKNEDPLLSELPEIKLVTIFPSKPLAEDLYCELKTVRMDDHPVYRALSYTWGDCSKTVPIYLDGRPFHVTTNLNAALRRLRHRSLRQTYWIDSICIDQSNIQERNHQVKYMRYIYKNAVTVHVWLGEATDQEEQQYSRMLSFLCKLGEGRHLDPGREASNVPPSNRFGVQWRVELLALEKLMSWPWWSRVWVMQEVAVARWVRVHLGSLEFDWRDLMTASGHYLHHASGCCREYLYENEMWQLAAMDNFTYHMRRHHTCARPFWNLIPAQIGWEGAKLIDVLPQLRVADASDPRDKVYAGLGLVASWQDREPLYPDYSLGVTNVYTRATFEILHRDRALDVLNFCQAGSIRFQLPSWVPDWSCGLGGRYGAVDLRRVASYNASNGHNAHISVCDDTTLELEGLSISAVTKLGELFEAEDPLPKYVSKLRACQRIAGQDSEAFHWLMLPDIYSSGSGWFSTRWRRSTSEDWGNFQQWLCDIERGAESGPGWLQEHVNKIDTSDIEKSNLLRNIVLYDVDGHRILKMDKTVIAVFRESLLRYLAGGKRFFLTSNGIAGTGPRDMKVGDQCFVFKGGRTPFVIRQRDTSTSTDSGILSPSQHGYTLIGECYMAGVMDGEIVQRNSEGWHKAYLK